ncbi:MAG: hypothetical protein ABIK09_02770 [Pseudomonadota bacterium]
MDRTLAVADLLPRDAGSPYPGDAALAGPGSHVSDALSALYDGGFRVSVDDGGRVFARTCLSARTGLVVGRSQDIGCVVNTHVAEADGVPVHRRRGGGGAVVLGPRMLVIAASARSEGRFDVHTPFERSRGRSGTSWPGSASRSAPPRVVSR